MRILIVIPRIDIVQGGPSYATINLCLSLAKNDVKVSLFTTKPSGNVPLGTGQGFNVTYFEQCFPKRYSNSNNLIKAIKGVGKQFDIIHIIGLWSFITTRAAKAAKYLGIPYVLTPSGMLSAWSRGFSRLDKELYFTLFEKKTIQWAGLIHFLTDIEASSSKSFCGSSQFAVIPNGIWPEEFEGLSPDGFRKRFNLDDSRLVMFLGRLSQIKRLDLQCKTFSLLAKRFPDLKWIFVGPDDGVADYIRSYMEDAGLSSRTIQTGLMSGKERLSALAAATVYCHTSEHEAHSVAITEALAAGKPCVVTKGCHFDEIESANAGKLVKATPQEICKAIEDILLNPKMAKDMGKNARSLAHSKYNWDIIAKQMIEVYKETLSR